MQRIGELEVNMKLNVAALAIAAAVVWGGCVFLVGLANLAMPDYGGAFLAMVASIYPGYHAGRDFLTLLLGSAYALADGAIGGAIVAWLYNVVALSQRESAEHPATDHSQHRHAH